MCACVDVRGQLDGVSCPPLLHGFWRSNSGHHAWAAKVGLSHLFYPKTFF